MNYERMYRSAENQRRFAWAKYYEVVRDRHGTDYHHYQTMTRYVAEDNIPEHIKTEIKTMADQLKKVWDCPICLDFIPTENLEITPCGHFYCKPCLAQLKQQEDAKCGICRRKFRETR